MEPSTLFLKLELIQIVGLCIKFLGVAAGFLVIILLLHTISVLGRASPLYRKRQPVAGWNRRFYPACVGLIILILVAMKFLDFWARRL